MKIGIIGCGFVGGTTLEVLKNYYEVVAYDKFKREYMDNFDNLASCEVIFIAVPTPMQDSGKIDLSILHEVLDSLKNLNFKEKPILVIRSTAIPGTTEELSKKYDFEFVYNPEFLREKNALDDFKNTNRVILGSDRNINFEKIKSIYSSFLPKARYFFTDWKTAEMAKYAANSVLTSQIIMANEIYQICKKLDIDYNKIKNILSLDNRIAKNIDVPGPDGNLGFGGKCFPKDLNAIIQLAKEKGYKPDFFEEVWNSNIKLRESRDWEKIPGATSKNNNF